MTTVTNFGLKFDDNGNMFSLKLSAFVLEILIY